MQRSMIVIGAIVVVLIFVSVANGLRSNPAPREVIDALPVVSAAQPALLPVKVVLECENADELSDANPKAAEKVMVKGQVSEGQTVSYLEIPDGWENACGIDDKTDPDKIPGRATYSFELPRDDTFYINLRAKWLDSCGNSVFVRIDDGNWFNLEDENGRIGDKNYKWAWHQLFLGGRPKSFELKAGKHKLLLNTREDGPKLDQVVINSDANPPVGDSPVKK